MCLTIQAQVKNPESPFVQTYTWLQLLSNSSAAVAILAIICCCVAVGFGPAHTFSSPQDRTTQCRFSAKALTHPGVFLQQLQECLPLQHQQVAVAEGLDGKHDRPAAAGEAATARPELT